MANQYDTNLKLQAIADAIGDSQSSGLISALEDIADAVAGGGGSSAGLVSDNFSETDTYDLGDYCIHNNTLYVCINAITTPGAWDLSDWQATNAGLELSSLNSALANVGKLEYIMDIPSSATTWVDTGKYKGLVVRAVISGYTVEARTSILSSSSDYVLPICLYANSSNYIFINATVNPNRTLYGLSGYAGFSLMNIKLYGVL